MEIPKVVKIRQECKLPVMADMEETIHARIEALKIAEKIKTTAAAYGIGPENLVFDPLAMTVSADPRAALVTLESLRAVYRPVARPVVKHGDAALRYRSDDCIEKLFIILHL